jgi:hypothetical protein
MKKTFFNDLLPEMGIINYFRANFRGITLNANPLISEFVSPQIANSLKYWKYTNRLIYILEKSNK